MSNPKIPASALKLFGKKRRRKMIVSEIPQESIDASDHSVTIPSDKGPDVPVPATQENTIQTEKQPAPPSPAPGVVNPVASPSPRRRSRRFG